MLWGPLWPPGRCPLPPHLLYCWGQWYIPYHIAFTPPPPSQDVTLPNILDVTSSSWFRNMSRLSTLIHQLSELAITAELPPYASTSKGNRTALFPLCDFQRDMQTDVYQTYPKKYNSRPRFWTCSRSDSTWRNLCASKPSTFASRTRLRHCNP